MRRPRAVGRPVVPPGPLADLKDLLYELYLAAGMPALNDIASWIKEDDELAGAPGRDTVARVIGDPGMPASQADVAAVAAVLARAARWDPDDAGRRARDLWTAARMARPAGVPLEEVTDPLALEVHKPVETDGPAAGLPLLPPYVRREHDALLAEAVARAAAGGSVMAVLVAGSSAGKTRACWEALEPLRQDGGWRLWHPRDPARTEAVLRELPGVGPRTVVWLNETQEYLSGEDGGERVAAGLRSLLADPARAPVLVLGTLWPGYHAALTSNHASQARQLLDGTVIPVPDAFTGADLTAFRQAAAADPRLAQAAMHAEDGHVAQYLAGAPALLERFRAAPPAARALILAAMDARRLGMGPVLPLAFLEDAAPGYLTGTEWDGLGDDWAEQALAYTAVPCKGARGPLTRIRPRPAKPGTGRDRAGREPAAGPACRLADYLDQHGRAQRAARMPPPEFWAAAAAHAAPGDQAALGTVAHARGLYRDAAQFRKNAAHGSTRVARDLVTSLHALHPGDLSPARWAAAHASLSDPGVVPSLLGSMQEAGLGEEAAALAGRAAADTDVSSPVWVARLMDSMRGRGLGEQAAALASRAAADTDVSHPGWTSLLDSMRGAGLGEQAAVLAGRAAARIDVTNLRAVERLMEKLRRAGFGEQTAALAGRAADASVSDPEDAAVLLDILLEAGFGEQAAALAGRAAAHVSLSDPDHVADLLNTMLEAGLGEQFAALASRAAADADLSDPGVVASLLDSLGILGADEQAAVLLARDPAAHASLSDPLGVALLLDRLWQAGAGEEAVVLAGRAAAHASLSNPDHVADLLDSLREAGMGEEAAELGRRAAAQADVIVLPRVKTLLGRLREAGLGEEAAELGRRAAAQADLKDLEDVAILLEAGLGEEAVVLARRAVAQADPSDPRVVASLLARLLEAGLGEEAAELGRRAAAQANVKHPDVAGILLARLLEAGLGEEAAELGRRAAAHADPSDPRAVASLLARLREAGLGEEAAELGRRAAAQANVRNPGRVASLLARLREAGLGEEAAELGRRAAAQANVRSPGRALPAAILVHGLREAGLGEEAAELGSRAAAHADAYDREGVAILLGILREAAQGEQRVVPGSLAAARANLDLSDPVVVSRLQDSLRRLGAEEQVVPLAAHLPAVGMFEYFLTLSQTRGQFRFGREADGTPAAPWGWDDLS